MNEAENLYRRGRELLEADPAHAVQLLSMSLQMNPDAPPALYNRAVAYARLGQDVQAAGDLQRLERIAPAIGRKLRAEMALSVEPATDIARTEYLRGNFEAAIIKCDSALAYEPGYGDAWVVKGMALEKLGQVDKALECYTQATKVAPDNYAAYLNRAELHYEHKRLQEAVADFSRAIELQPCEPDAYLRRAAVYADLNRPDRAAADKQKGEELSQSRKGGRQEVPLNYVARLQELGCTPPSDPPDHDVDALEASIGVPLPASYRAFLLNGGGWWGDLLCPCREPTPFGSYHGVNGFHDAGEVRNLLSSDITPRNMVMIAIGNREKYTCLSVAGIDRGFVYAVDGEFRVYWSDEEFHERFNAIADSILNYLELRRQGTLPEKPVGYDSVYLLAEDFDEFLSSCRPA